MPDVLPTRDGREWAPRYLESVDPDACIGCGRCFKVCDRAVMMPIERPHDDDLDDDEDDIGGTMMTVADPGNCIGCMACARTCVKKALAHVAA